MPTVHPRSRLSSFARRLFSGLVLAAVVSPLATAQTAVQTRIQNGVAATPNAYPWLVSIGNGDIADAKAAHYCGGTLITDRWVVTAAHCFSDTTVAANQAVVVGRTQLTDRESGQRIPAAQIVRHPKFNPVTFDNDIALVLLSTPVTGIAPTKFSVPATPVAEGTVARAAGHGALAAPVNYLTATYPTYLPCSTYLDGCLSEMQYKGASAKDIVRTLLLANGLNDPAKGVGYSELVAQILVRGVYAATTQSFDDVYAAMQKAGITLMQATQIITQAAASSNEVRQVDLPVVSNSQCAARYESGVTNNMLCAGYANQPLDTCQGDSGGPLFVRNAQNSNWIQIGIVSFGGVCGTGVGVYTKLANYLDWMNQYLNYFTEERLFNWAEVAAGSILKPLGTETTTTISGYLARCYTQSNKCIGTDGFKTLYYDGQSILNIGIESDFIAQSRQAGY